LADLQKDAVRASDFSSPADIESLCKKATLSAIVEFQNGALRAPFAVPRDHFLAVLQSDNSHQLSNKSDTVQKSSGVFTTTYSRKHEGRL
jgi:SpoVK/Ycf46/Vps4 family AAA+-type ATPase